MILHVSGWICITGSGHIHCWATRRLGNLWLAAHDWCLLLNGIVNGGFTPGFMAPEICVTGNGKQSIYSVKSDIFAFGAMLQDIVNVLSTSKQLSKDEKEKLENILAIHRKI